MWFTLSLRLQFYIRNNWVRITPCVSICGNAAPGEIFPAVVHFLDGPSGDLAICGEWCAVSVLYLLPGPFGQGQANGTGKRTRFCVLQARYNAPRIVFHALRDTFIICLTG